MIPKHKSSEEKPIWLNLAEHLFIFAEHKKFITKLFALFERKNRL